MSSLPSRLPNRLPSYGGLAQNTEGRTPQKSVAQVSAAFPYYSLAVSNAVILSKSITTTKTCMIVAMGSCFAPKTGSYLQIQRGGVNKTLGDTTSGADANGWAIAVCYATEILPPGTYQYDLYINAFSVRWSGCTLEVIAIND